MNILIKAAILSILPIAELRGGIPYALAHDVDYVTAYLLCVSVNILAFPVVYLFMGVFHNWFIKMSWYQKLFDKIVARTRRKVEKNLDKWGFWGLMIFVMIPLPVTGAYTGSFAAWVFGIEKKRAFLAVALGVAIAGIIVTAIVLSGMESLRFLYKNVE